MKTRTADPYRNLDVIDERAPRFNQTAVALAALIATATGWWPLLGLMGAQLLVGLTFGRRFCLPCVVYFEWVQPLIGEGALEDSRAPRFANIIGAAVLSSAALAHAVGWHRVGLGLGVLVGALAALAATTGLCVGCKFYWIWARATRRSTP